MRRIAAELDGLFAVLTEHPEARAAFVAATGSGGIEGLQRIRREVDALLVAINGEQVPPDSPRPLGQVRGGDTAS